MMAYLNLICNMHFSNCLPVKTSPITSTVSVDLVQSVLPQSCSVPEFLAS